MTSPSVASLVLRDLVAALESNPELAGRLRAVLASDAEPAGPTLLDRNGLASALGISLGSLDRLRREGMPVLRVGDAPRFVLADCVAWLQRRQDGGALRLVRGNRG